MTGKDENKDVVLQGDIPPPARAASDVEALADWLDAKFRIPGTNFRFGFDALIGLIPGGGDAAMALIGAYIILRAMALGAPASTLLRMVFNLLLDAIVGAIPLLGDLFDFAYRSNLKNARLLQAHLDNRA